MWDGLGPSQRVTSLAIVNRGELCYRGGWSVGFRHRVGLSVSAGSLAAPTTSPEMAGWGPLRSRLGMVVIIVALVVGSVGGAFAVGLLGTPHIVGVENHFGAVTDRTTVVETDLQVNNPNPFGVRVGGTTIDYRVHLNTVTIASGSKKGLRLERGSSRLSFRTLMRNRQIPKWWVTHVRNGERSTVTVDAHARPSLLRNRSIRTVGTETVETDLIGSFESETVHPVTAPWTPRFTSSPFLYVNRTNATWGRVSEAETPIHTSFLVYNPQPYPIPITEIGYRIWMNGIRVGEGASERGYLVPSGETQTVRARSVIRNSRLDDWWVSHIRNNQMTDLRIEFYARIELPSGRTVRLSFEALEYQQRIETDIFGTKDDRTSTPTSAS